VAEVGLAHAAPRSGPGLFGCAATPGIVSVTATNDGHARVWRRLPDGTLELSEHRFPNWFLATDLDLFGHLTPRRLSGRDVASAHGQLPPNGLRVVELAGGGRDAYRYLVLTDRLAEIEAELLDTYNKRVSGQATSLSDLRGLVLAVPPVEQFLLLTGRTYFGGLRYQDLVRLQFDLETTGLDEQRDRIFMISLRDSTGWRACLDTGSSSMSEAELIRQFVELVRRRDPDVLENHNIFAFDLSFLARRATRLGVHLGLGRDGSIPRLGTDVFRAGDRSETFTRWLVAGREVVDTQHAVRHYGADAPDMRRHGLKDAARYFGFARAGREYVPGAEIWSTFRADPERVRRYAGDDVDEVDGLSRRLLPASFALATMLPRAYERIVSDPSPRSLLEPLLMRAYLHAGRAVPAPLPQSPLPNGGRIQPDLLVRGVVQEAAMLALVPLFASLIAADGIRPAQDELGAFPRLVADLLARADQARVALAESLGPSAAPDRRASEAMSAGLAADPVPEDVRAAQAGARLAALERLVEAAPAYLAGTSFLFSDTEAAGRLRDRARGVMDTLLAELRALGATVAEVAGQRVLVATPGPLEQTLADRMAPRLPPGVRLVQLGRYRAAYLRAPGSHILLGHDGGVSVVGSAFRAGKRERYGELFVRAAAPLALTGDAPGLRRLFLETVRQLRRHEVAVADLCVQETLHKAAADYRRAGYREEPYELLIASGVKTWRPGVRVRYFRDQAGGLRLLREGEPPAEPDWEHYVQRLRAVYAQHFAAAFTPDDFARVFHLPRPDAPASEADDPLDDVRPIAEPVLTTLQF
jgi:DNA polymerase, archaea type